ncbi:hypothetical protein [Methylobacterium sp. WL103]|uniref:hypothetical protein n=1 Tax=Methylobacterium sp. WL103 TaxID=2603891 RepID=UPI00164F5CBC|nr:hypothetical protein [Methylobacterium sp. WL103]
MEIAPTSMMKMEIAQAKIGRSMKKRVMGMRLRERNTGTAPRLLGRGSGLAGCLG